MTAQRPLTLASASMIRLQLMQRAGLDVTARAARIDERQIRASLEAEGANPRSIADTLAEMKARKLATPGHLVLGCDQVLEVDGAVWGKPDSLQAARGQLSALRGRGHLLHSAIVLYDGIAPVWRHIGEARLTMRNFSDSYLEAYLDRNWPAVSDSVGAYKLEEEGARLFTEIQGDHFTILGLPLLPLLTYLGLRGFIAT